MGAAGDAVVMGAVGGMGAAVAGAIRAEGAVRVEGATRGMKDVGGTALHKNASLMLRLKIWSNRKTKVKIGNR